jgi:hypothetical protein
MDKKASPSRTFDPPEEAVWHRMISEAAYYRAQKGEFSGESALEHWLAAEEEIRRVLTAASSNGAPITARGAKGGAVKSAARKRQIPKSG